MVRANKGKRALFGINEPPSMCRRPQSLSPIAAMPHSLFSMRSLNLFLGSVGAEVLVFLGSELFIRFLVPYPGKRAEQMKLMTVQVCVLLVGALLLHIFHHKPFLLVAIVIFMFFRLLFVYSNDVAEDYSNSAHVHVSKPLRKSLTSNRREAAAIQSSQPQIGSVSRPSTSFHRPGTYTAAGYPSTSTIGVPQASSALRQRFFPGSSGPRLQKLSSRGQVLSKADQVYSRSNHPVYPSTQSSVGVAATSLGRTPLQSSTDHVSKPTVRGSYYGYSGLGYITSLWDRQRPSDCPPGISNSGNTCFINSTLHSLAWTPGFLELLKTANTRELQPSSTTSPNAQLLKSLHSVLERCHVIPDGSSSFSAIDSSEFLADVSQLAPYLVASPKSGQRQSQQDASEFLLWLLDNLPSDVPSTADRLSAPMSEMLTSTSRKKEECLLQLRDASSDEVSTLREPLSELAALDWILQSKKGSSLIRDLFLGQIMEARECQNCKKMSVNVEYFTVLPLPIPDSQLMDGRRQSLDECFNCFGNVEELNSSNMMACSCSPAANQEELILTPGKRLAMLSRLPKRLILQLTRFAYNTELRAARKNATPISVPTIIDIAPYLMESKLRSGSTTPAKRVSYKLCALCIHTGAQSTSFGHYVAYCKASSGTWYCFNDSYVTVIVDMEQELQSLSVLQNAYLLFYAAAE